MASIRFARRRARSVLSGFLSGFPSGCLPGCLAGCLAVMLLGCRRAEPPPVAVAGTQLAADYAEALSALPEVTVEKGSPWSGLAIEDAKVVAQFSETSFSVAEITAQLEQMTATFEALRSISGREDRFPDNVGPSGEILDLGVSAGRSARDAARFLRTDAIRLFALGEVEPAARRLAVGLGIVRQLARSDAVANINGYGIFTFLVDPLPAMVEGAAGRTLDPAAKTILRDAIDRLDPRAPFGPSLPADVAGGAAIEFERARRLLAAP